MWSASIDLVVEDLRRDVAWEQVAAWLTSGGLPDRALHLAVFVEPFLEYVLSGRKTVESRFSSVRVPPFQRVARGDVVLLKKSGGPVVGICEVGAAWYYRLDSATLSTIKREFAAALCADTPDFWKSRSQAEFASLMFVSRVRRLPAIEWPKRDRRGWVVVRDRTGGPLFGEPMNNIVLGFSGGIASGKSTLSEAVAASLGCSRVSFGEAIRAEAGRRRRKPDRKTLQEIGEELVRDNHDQLCRSVLAQADWARGEPLVIDGVRHVAVADCIRELVAPSKFRLVYVTAKRESRVRRLGERGEGSADLNKLDVHSTESEVHNQLPEMADLVVDGNQPLESAIEAVSYWASAQLNRTPPTTGRSSR